jgi:4-amino-4-deoxy-L-arabinose transferase-like glycosyltransferase
MSLSPLSLAQRHPPSQKRLPAAQWWQRPGHDALLLAGLWLAGVLVDALWVQRHQLPPAWDQGDHLSRALGFWQVLHRLQPFDPLWWHQLWAQAPSYRGPLTYLVTAPLFSLLGPGYGTAILSNAPFQALLLASLYGQGRLLGNRAAGLWAAFLACVAPALLQQRTDYLIDFSLTAVITACWLLLSWRRLGQPRHPWLASALAGLGLGAVLLTRPTGLLLLWWPLLLLLIRAAGQLWRQRWQPLAQAALAAALAWLLAGGWFSQNWLTILSTMNNARRWGVLYQEGLEPGTLAGWLFYPRLLPAMAGIWLVATVLAGGLLHGWRRGRWPHLPAGAEPRRRALWWLSYPLGALLLATLMSTKDMRFVLPLLPQLLLLLGGLIAASARWLQAAALALGVSGLLACQFGIGPNLSGFPSHLPRQGEHWPLAEIVASIRQRSPEQLSTLAVLPDSEFLNAFNLEAEGRRQGFRVAARQTTAPLEHLDGDLAGFDWFLLKGGDQGVMSDERQARLSALVRQSPAFMRAGQWPLPDGSRAELYRRRQLSLDVAAAPCPADGRPRLELWPPQPGTGILLSRLSAWASQLEGAKLLLSGHDHAVGQGLLRPVDPARGCLAVLERLQPTTPTPAQAPAASAAPELLLADGRRMPLTVVRPAGPPPSGGDEPALARRHDQLLQMGELLRRGQLKQLFALVGRINQHDPEQSYLTDGEAILNARLQGDPGNLSLLYPLALAQALQRRADAAAISLSRITRLDPGNATAHLGRAAVELYRFRPWAALPQLQQSLRLPSDSPIQRELRRKLHVLIEN